MEKLKIEYVPIGELKTYASNAKVHTAEQIESIKKSIQEFGMNDPIAVWKDNEIIEGHGRLIACNELGLEEVPVIRLDGLTDEQRKAYTIVHNKLTLNTAFDIDTLSEELKNLNDEFDFTDLGFGEFELSVLTEDMEPSEYDEGLLEQFDGVGEGMLAKKRVIINYSDETEPLLLNLLKLKSI